MKKKTILCVAAVIVAAIVSITVVSCKKDKDEVVTKATNSEAQALLNCIEAFQTLRDAVNSGEKVDGSMTVEELRQVLDLVTNYEHSEHMTYCVGTVLDTLRIAMPLVDNEGNVSENDVVATYNSFEIELQKCLDAVDDGKVIPSYFSILMPENIGKDFNEIEIVFIRGVAGEYPKENQKNRDDDGPFIEEFDYWHWGDSLGLCKPDPYSCTSDAAQQLSEEFVYVIPAAHQGESYIISNVVHVLYSPCSRTIPGVSTTYYQDPYMEDCADTWLFCSILPYYTDPCLNSYELNCFWRSIVRNIVDPSAPLHYAPLENSALLIPYHYCIIESNKFYFEVDYYKLHIAHVIYCEIEWPGNENPPIH